MLKTVAENRSELGDCLGRVICQNRVQREASGCSTNDFGQGAKQLPTGKGLHHRLTTGADW